MGSRPASIVAALLLALSAALAPRSASAHDIPESVRVQAFVKPEGPALRVLVRVPLEAMRDVDVPRRGSGMLDLRRAEPALREAADMWLSDALEIREDDSRLPRPRVARVRVSLPSDRSFGSYEAALAHFSAPPLPEGTELYWSQGLLDAWLEYPIASERSSFAIHPGFERLGVRVDTVVRYVTPDGDVRAFDLHGDPGLVRLDPSWHQAAARFVEAGFRHILSGPDHLLFLVLLVLPFRRLLPLAAIVTAFTVAHSITLVAAGLGYGPRALWFPPLVETLIAASIVYMAIDNFFGARLGRRWVLTLAFGLIHGFGFAYGLNEILQFAGSHLVLSLLAFNVGVELGQLALLCVLVPLLNAFLKICPEKPLVLVASLLAGHTAWHWMLERGEKLAKFPFPPLDEASLLSALRWLAAFVAAGAAAWLGARGLAKALRGAAHGRMDDERSRPEERQ